MNVGIHFSTKIYITTRQLSVEYYMYGYVSAYLSLMALRRAFSDGRIALAGLDGLDRSRPGFCAGFSCYYCGSSGRTYLGTASASASPLLGGRFLRIDVRNQERHWLDVCLRGGCWLSSSQLGVHESSHEFIRSLTFLVPAVRM